MAVYRCEATTVEGFVQQLAVQYVVHGFYHYVTGRIPHPKDPGEVDRKILEKYGIAISGSQRRRQKLAGRAALHYIRFRRFFVIIATDGYHEFKDEEGGALRDIRQTPIQFFGYSIGCSKRGRTSVRIAHGEYLELKARFLDLAVHRTADYLGREFNKIPFERYARVNWQIGTILRHVNRARKKAGFELVPSGRIRWRRRIVKPFEVVKDERSEKAAA